MQGNASECKSKCKQIQANTSKFFLKSKQIQLQANATKCKHMQANVSKSINLTI